ncbi:MAG: Polar amino acid transport system permease protein [Tardiphaga sp.]|uniref:amino acid ABC transporter permease n=1 Tax=Tardiphaga sp. TaxID=1926292 RepID=UPI0026231E31|nr:amino acid ABC transporter permease [Tardiphaga sp.]MDB5501557.1 Polar amino acid transport system permease protein [Tardiphaga sp.]
MLDISVITNNWQYFAQGIWVTVVVTTSATILGFCIGFIIALVRTSTLLPLRIAGGVYVEVLRNVPFIILLFLFFYGLPFAGIRIPERVAGTIALAMFASAYYAEILRGAMAAVPRGQVEAARAIGFTQPQILRYIIAPQMWKFALPPMAGTTTMAIKESSILSTITVAELTYQGLIVQGMTFAPFEVFFAVASLYWIFTALLSWGFRRTERAVGSPELAAVFRSPLARKYLSLDHRR